MLNQIIFEMNLSCFAPQNFKEHLWQLEHLAQFNKARLRSDLGINKQHQHYIITGNDGVGKSDAVNEIYKRIADVYEFTGLVSLDAMSLYDATNGFGSNLLDSCSHNTLIHIKNAEMLGMKGNINTRTGLEELCYKMSNLTNIVVVLTGHRSQLLELVKGHEKARDWFSLIFHFDDLTPENMFQYMEEYINTKNYILDPSADTALKSYLCQVYKQRGSNFRNIYFLQEIFNQEIVPRISERVVKQNLPFEQMDLCTIMPEDMPGIEQVNTEDAIHKLESLVGLESIKKQILDHTALVKLNKLRSSKGLFNKMPPMHMVFTGNPGTGKTTVAQYLGEIYHSIGVLSSGHVVVTERSKLVGEFIGETEKKTINAIRSASGGVLFIDEAYNLFVRDTDKKDYGMRVIETLLTFLSTEDTNMIVILAGYTNEMKKMLGANPGLESRFPYIFEFEDYTPEQLMQIAKIVLDNEHYAITPEAERKLAKYVIHEYDNKDEHFGNGRFITRLITTHIIPSLSRRLLMKPVEEITQHEMETIEACDIPDVATLEYKAMEMDETILTEALERLNALTALQNAKQALHDYVTISKHRHQQGVLKATPQSLCWYFIGKTGTGKSTVAKILGRILQGLGILKRGKTVCVNAEELTGKDCYIVLERAIKESKDGLLFLDMDAPNAKNYDLGHLRMWVFNKLRELQQTTALVFAQIQASEDMIAQNLATNGIAAYGNTIVFNDFSAAELSDILAYLLKKDYQLDIQPDAKAKLQKYVESVKSNDTKESPINVRTVDHLAQTIAHITQLRVAQSNGERLVTLPDVSHFKWNRQARGKIGFV